MEEADCAWAGESPEAVEKEASDVNPLNLAALFGGEEGGQRRDQHNNNPQALQRAVAVAGLGLDDEFELKKLQVFVRIRPSKTQGAPRWDTENCIHATSKYSIAIAPPEASQAYKNGDRGQTYSFTRVFDEDTPQQEYFDSTAAPLVRDLLRNPQHNSVMMAYGITAAGKTYTIEGTAAAPGVMPRALGALFEGLADHVEAVSVRVAYYEVYNENIFDLLEDAPVGPGMHRAALKLKEDSQGRVFVGGLTEVEVTSAAEALKVLRRGSKQRQRAETGLNYSSSRSHSIFTVMLYQPKPPAAEGGEQQEEEGEEAEERLGRLSFVDLAGSERAQRTGNVGVRLKESVAINSSLMTLGRCLEALHWNQQHKGAALKVVPYRESKVTHLFRDALHGWGQVILSVNVSPCAKDYDETSHVLKYAALATQIGTIQQAEAPRRVIKAVTPAIKKVKRKAALPPEARGARVKIKRAKKEASPQPAAAEEEEEQQEAAGSGPVGAVPAEQASGDGSPAEAAAAGATQRGGQAPGEGEEDDTTAGKAHPGEGLGGDGPEFDGTPATPLEDIEDEGVVADLQAQVKELVAQLQRAEERCVLVETEVREEVAEEMEQLLREMEANYKERLAAEVAQVECKLAGAAQQAATAGNSRRGRGRGKAAAAAEAEAEDDAGSAPAQQQWEALAAAAAEQNAARLQEQVDSLAAELSGAQQRAEELGGALEESREQCAAQQGQVAQLERALASAHQLAAAAEQQRIEQSVLAAGLRTQLEQAAAREAALQTELEAQQKRGAALAAEVQAVQQQAQQARAEAERQAESTLQEERTQLEANRAMEVEMLEEQLHRSKKDNAALRQRLEAAMATLATVASPSVPLLQRMAQACPAGNGRGAGGTPHDVALARARQAAAEEELEQAAMAAAAAPAGAATMGPSRQGKASGRASRFAGGSATAPALASGPAQEAAQAPSAAAGAQPPAQQQPGGQPEGLAGEEAATGAAPAPAVQSQRARRTTRASAAHAAPPMVDEAQAPEAAAAVGKPAAKGRRVRRATRAAQAVLAPIEEAAELDGEQRPEACASAAAVVDTAAEGGAQAASAPTVPEAAGEPDQQLQEPAAMAVAAAEQQQQSQQQQEEKEEEAAAQHVRKGGRKGRRRTTAQPAGPDFTAAAEPSTAEQQVQPSVEPDAQQSLPPNGAEPEGQHPTASATAPPPQPPRRRGRRATTTALACVAEEGPAEEGCEEAAGAAEGRGDGGGGSAATTTEPARGRAQSMSRHPDNKENEGQPAPAAGAKRPAGSKAVRFAAIAEEPEPEAVVAEQGGGEAGARHPHAAQPEAQPAAPAGKRRRKLLSVAAESKEMLSALGELQEDLEAGGVGRRGRPRRQTQFFRL